MKSHAHSPRIVSLLPSATEIVAALKMGHALVGRSHECDYPADVAGAPVLTRPRRALPTSSGAIDRAVREILEDAIAVYEVDVEGLRAAEPDVIVTQDLCDVCAVSLDDVRAALRELAREDVRVVSLKPMRLADVWDDVRRVAEALGRGELGAEVATSLERRCATIGRRAAEAGPRRSVLTIEWIDPVMIGGTWMPELVRMAGGHALVTEPGQHAPTLSRDELSALDPDVVLIKPCGFDLERTRQELDLLPRVLPWERWSAVDRGDVYVADGNAYFNRPGPRLVDSLEILAACVHPAHFGDFAARHAGSIRRISRELGWNSVMPAAAAHGPVDSPSPPTLYE